MGARARRPASILIRPAPVPGLMGRRSMALPEFDPFWSRVAEAGILVGMHGSDSGYQRYQNEWEGIRRGEMLPFRDEFGVLARSCSTCTDRSSTPSRR